MDEWALRRHLEAPYVQLARRILHRCGIWSQGITVTVVIGTRKPREGIAKDLPSVVAATTFSRHAAIGSVNNFGETDGQKSDSNSA